MYEVFRVSFKYICNQLFIHEHEIKMYAWNFLENYLISIDYSDDAEKEILLLFIYLFIFSVSS